MTTPEPHYAFFQTYIFNLNETWKSNADMIGFVSKDREKTALLFITPVLVYYYEAVRSFLAGNYVSSILASSASVEFALNNENKMHGWNKKPDDWLYLWNALKLASKHGLPAKKLLDSEFALFRDKFAHGDIFPFVSQTLGLASFGGNPNFAVEQLRLAHDFLIALYSPRTTES